jgi:hypothetical protein
VSHLPYLLALGLLGSILLMREAQNHKLVKGLIDKILLQHGLDVIPENHPLAEAITSLRGEAEKPVDKKESLRTTFQIPGMDIMQRLRKK